MTYYEKVKKRYNGIMTASGNTPLTGEEGNEDSKNKWNIADMVSECQHLLEKLYGEGTRNNVTVKLKSFISDYREFIELEKPTRKHNSKFDNI